MKYKYLAIACLLSMGGLSFTSCADEFSEINSSEADINNPNIRYLFTQCLNEFEPMDYTAWFYDIPRMNTWMQCTVGQMEANTSGVNGNSSGFNLITEQGSIGYAVNDVLRYANDIRYHISQMSEEEKARNEYLGYLCYPLQVFLGMNDSDMYGSRQYSEAELSCSAETLSEYGLCRTADCITCFQSNHEGDLIDAIQDAYGSYAGIVINPGAYTHTSIAILDAAKAVGLPMIEVHISKVDEREEFRKVSYIRAACFETIAGMGVGGYRKAMFDMAAHLGI